MKAAELTGQRFYYLTVVEKLSPTIKESVNGTTYQYRLWKCLCDCDNYVNVTTQRLRSGLKKSCGCMNYTAPHKNRKYKPGDNSVKGLLNRYQQTARKREYAWGISEELFTEVIFLPCFYCGTEPKQEYSLYKNRGNSKTALDWAKKSTILYNGIDRIDNSIGYTVDNIVSCCMWCNSAKSTRTQQEFFEWAKKVADWNNL